MNNGGYSTQDPTALGSKVEEIVRADLESSAPVPYTTQAAESAETSVGTFLSDAAKYFVGGKQALLGAVSFDLTQPRPLSLQVNLLRRGVGAVLGQALYSTPLSKPVAGKAELGDGGLFSAAKFTGDPALCEKLNANKDLRKRADKFARKECQNLQLEAPRYFGIEPAAGGGSRLLAAALPRSYSMGMKVSLDVKEFLELAVLVEAAL